MKVTSVSDYERRVLCTILASIYINFGAIFYFAVVVATYR